MGSDAAPKALKPEAWLWIRVSCEIRVGFGARTFGGDLNVACHRSQSHIRRPWGEIAASESLQWPSRPTQCEKTGKMVFGPPPARQQEAYGPLKQTQQVSWRMTPSSCPHSGQGWTGHRMRILCSLARSMALKGAGLAALGSHSKAGQTATHRQSPTRHLGRQSLPTEGLPVR